MMECMGGGGCMMGMHWLMWIFWILLIALLVWGAVWLVRRNRPGRAGHGSTKESPTETLQRRYAAGDISTEEYEERKRKLNE